MQVEQASTRVQPPTRLLGFFRSLRLLLPPGDAAVLRPGLQRVPQLRPEHLQGVQLSNYVCPVHIGRSCNLLPACVTGMCNSARSPYPALPIRVTESFLRALEIRDLPKGAIHTAGTESSAVYHSRCLLRAPAAACSCPWQRLCSPQLRSRSSRWRLSWAPWTASMSCPAHACSKNVVSLSQIKDAGGVICCWQLGIDHQ